MAGSLGTLTLDIVAKIGGYTAGLSKAEVEAKKRAAAIEKAFDAAAVGVGVAFGAMATAAVGAFAIISKGIDEAAKFQDLSDKTGAAADEIAGFAVAADTAGVSIDEVAGAMNKLTKNLEDVKKPGDETAQALKNLGINVNDFLKLDPAKQYEALANSFNSFADGASKVSNAMALFGKSGAEQLKVFKALEDQGGKTNILTAEQIKLADDYADKQAAATATLKLYVAALSTEAIPAMTAVINSFKELIAQVIAGKTEVSNFALNLTLLDWAEKIAVALGTVIESIVGIGKAVRAVGGSFQSVAADINVLSGLNPFGGDTFKEALANREKVAREANDRYVDLWKYNGTQVTDTIKKNFANQKAIIQNMEDPEIRRLLARSNSANNPTKAPLAAIVAPTPKGPKGPKEKDPYAEAQRYLESLQKQLLKTEELSTAEQALAEIQSGRLGKVTESQKAQILETAKQIDSIKDMKKLTDALEAVNVKLQEVKGNTAEAAAVKFDKENSAFFKIFTQQGNQQGLDKLETLKKLTVAAAQFAAAQDKFGKQQSDLSRQEERLARDQELGITGQIDGLVKLGQARVNALNGMKSAFAELQSIEKSGVELTDSQKESMKELQNQIDDLSTRLDPLAEKFNGIIGDATGQFFEDIIDGSKSAKDAFADFTKSIIGNIAKIIAQDAAKSLVSGAFLGDSGGGGFNWGSLLSGIFGGGRANGGPVMPNTLYRVNENGPEMFQAANGNQYLMTDNQSGRVNPNGGGGVVINQTFASGTSSQTTQQAALQASRELRKAQRNA